MWTIGGYAAGQVLRLGGNVILARLLFPEAFGLMMVVNVFMQGLQMFSDVGVGPSIVRHKDGEQADFLNTAWTIQIVRGLVVWAAAALLAWPVAEAYGTTELCPLIVTAGVGAVIAGFNSPAVFTLNRRLIVAPIVWRDLIAQGTGIAVMIGWASAWPSAWALVAGGLANGLVKMLLSHRLHEHVVRLRWDPGSVASMFRFGHIIMMSTAITFLANQSERIILAKYVPLGLVGVYAIGFMISRFGTQMFQIFTGRVLFPAVAFQLRHNEARALVQYRRLRLGADMGAVVIAILLVVLGPGLVGLLYDDRYSGAGWMIQILAIQCALDVKSASAWCLLLAAGEAHYNVWAGVARLLILWIGLPLAFEYGTVETAIWVVAASSGPSLGVFTAGVGRRYRSLRRSEWTSVACVVPCVIGGVLVLR